MKTALWIALAVVVGFVLGGIGPRRKSAELTERVNTLETDLSHARKAGARPIFPFPGLDWRRSDPAPPGSAKPASSSAGPDAARDRAPGERREGEWSWFGRRRRHRTPESDASGDDTPRTPEQRLHAFDVAATGQRARANQARQALKEQAHLTDEQLVAVDAVIARLNERIKPHADQLTQIVESDEPPEPSEFLWLSKEVTSILSDSQTELDRTVGSEKLDGVDRSAREIWNYIDLEMFRSAAEAGAQRENAWPARSSTPR